MTIQNINQSPFNVIKPLNNQHIEDKKQENETKSSKKDFNIVDKFQTSVRNSCDMEDTVTVPRTIFKGYLGFMAGTALGTLSGFAKKGSIAKKLLGISGALTCLYGTWSFVRPYVIKNSQKKQ